MNQDVSMIKVAKPVARSVRFRNEREDAWQDLEEIIDQIDSKGIKSVSAQDLNRLPSLYRSTLSALNVARATSLDRNLTRYLENLCSRAYLCVYTSRQKPLGVVWHFITHRLPMAVYAVRWHLFLSTMILFMGAIVAWVMVINEPEAFVTFVDAAYAQGRGPTSTREELRAVLFSGSDFSFGDLSSFSGHLMTHNARIGMMCFALSFAVGLPTLYLLFKNGAVLGAFAGVHSLKGLTVELFSWLLPHGVTEFLAVLLCGAAGFLVAEAILFPGRRTRLQNLAIQGRKAGVVVIGAVGLFLLAGLIEGFFRQSVQSIAARYAMAGYTAIVWFGYFGVLGWWRTRQALPEELEL